jgi:hypothetical protein
MPVAARKAMISYAQRLAKALAAAETAVALGSDVKLTTIGPKALDAFEATWRGQGRRVAWPWSIWARDFRRAHRSGLTLAIWYRDVLCGLAMGRAQTGKFVSLGLAEGNPNPAHPLKGKVIPIALTVAELYRIEIGARELRLYEADPALIPLYRSLGFELAPELGGPHHMRRKDPHDGGAAS